MRFSDIDEYLGGKAGSSATQIPGYIGFITVYNRNDCGGFDPRLNKSAKAALPAGFTYSVVPDLDRERVSLVSPGSYTVADRSSAVKGLSTVLRQYGIGLSERIPLAWEYGTLVLRLDLAT